MRILLVDIVRTSLGETWPGVEHSLGLMYIASYLRRRFGDRVTVRIVTLVSAEGREEAERQRVLRWLEEVRPAFVGIRCLSIGRDALVLVASTVREWDPACSVVAGGPYASDAPEEALRTSGADCVAIGEGEETAADLVERRLEGRPFTDVRGIAWLEGDAVVATPPRGFTQDLDALPLPDYDIVDMDAFTNRYLTFSSRVFRPHGNLLTTRGCPYQCMYCHQILGKRFRARSPESVVGEIRHLHDRYGFTDFQVVDDIFNLDVVRAKRICDLLIAGGPKITLSFPNGVRTDLLDEELVDKLRTAGTQFMSIAVETGSGRLQKLIRKNLNLDKVFRMIDYVSTVGIITRGFFMVGFPTETEDEARETVRFALESNLCGATFFTVVYFPGTPLYELARSLGYFAGGGPDVRRDYVQVGEGPYQYSREWLMRLKRDAIRAFAFDPVRLRRSLALLPQYFDRREIDAFLMAHILSADAGPEDVRDEWVRGRLHRHFLVAARFSGKAEFYV